MFRMSQPWEDDWKFPSRNYSAKELKEKGAWHVPGMDKKLCGWSEVNLGEREMGRHGEEMTLKR